MKLTCFVVGRDCFEEMMQFEEILFSITEFSDTKLNSLNELHREGKGTVFSFADICQQFELGTSLGTTKRCLST